jgi:hypothetical protein
MSQYREDMPEGMRRVRERLEQHYGFEQWARPEAGEELASRPKPRRYRPEAPDGFVLRSDTDHYSRYQGEEARSYVFEMEGGRAGGGPAVQVVVVQCSSAEAARASVMDVLASQMAVRLEPAGSLGMVDVAFARRARGRRLLCLPGARLPSLLRASERSPWRSMTSLA